MMKLNLTTLRAKIVKFVNRQPTRLLTAIAVISLMINYMTDGYIKWFFIALGLVTILISLTRSIRQSVKDRPDIKS